MEENKMLQYAKDIRTDLIYALQEDEDYLPKNKDVEVIKWLIEQAQRVEMYKSALVEIAENKVSPVFYAKSALYETEQRFNRRVNR